MDAAASIATGKAIQKVLSVIAALHLTSSNYPQSASYSGDLTYDYVIIGAGAAGSVLAARLTEDPNVKVALIEAGGDPTIEATLPGLFPLEVRMGYDYNFRAENDNLTCQHSQDKIAQMTAGKVLGGTTSMYHMAYLRGVPLDFSRWAQAAGNETWNYENLLPYFIKMEKFEIPEILNSDTADLHGTDGPLVLTQQKSELNDDYIKSMEEIGFKYNLDVNSRDTLGISDPPLLLSDGKRQGTANCYLSLNKDRKNLFVFKHTVATKILFDDNKIAIGVEAISSKNDTVTFKATKEVIVSAGAVRSPQLLMLSGIGPAEQLNQFNIPVISDLPVGETLLERPAVTLAFRMRASVAPAPIIPSPTKYPAPATVALKAFDESQQVADFQAVNLIFQHDTIGLSLESAFVLKYDNEITDRLIQANKGHDVFLVILSNGYPKSTGKLRLKNTDPLDQPKIDLGLFSNPSDIADMGKYLEYMSTLINTTYFQDVGAEIIDMGLTECSQYDKFSSDYWKCHAVSLSLPFWQTMSTCSMGSVVDYELKVKGVENLRVVDASVLPFFTCGLPGAAVIVTAEKAADMIRPPTTPASAAPKNSAFSDFLKKLTHT